MSSATFRATNKATASATTTITITKPSGTAVNDVLVAVVSSTVGAQNPNGNAYWSPPSGWVDITGFFGRIVHPPNPPYPSPTFNVAVFYKIATGSEGANYTFTAISSGNLVGAIVGYSATLGYDPSGSYVAQELTCTDATNSPTSDTNSTYTTAGSETSETIIIGWVALNDSGAISPAAGITSRSTTTGSGTTNSLLIGDLVAANPGDYAPQPTTGLSSTGWIKFNIALLPSGPSPLAPPLTAPINNAYSDISANGGPFNWAYNTGGGTGGETAYSFRRKISGGTYNYWNAGSSAFQSTDLANTTTATTLTFSANIWPDGQVYNWSVASTDNNGKGPYASDLAINAQVAPTVSVSAPTGSVTTTQYPQVIWSPTIAPGAVISDYRVITYNSTQYGAGGFVAGVGPNVDDSGLVASSANAYTITNPLATGVSYKSYVQLTQYPGGQTTAYTSTSFSVALDPPATPSLVATYGTDGTTECPRIGLAVTTQDNILSANDASFEGSLGTTAAIANCAVVQSATFAEDGTKSCRMTSTAGGDMTAGTATGASGYAVLPNTQYTWSSDYRSAVSVRSCRTDVSWYQANGTFISTTAGTAVNDATGSWTTSRKTATSPALSAFARIVHGVLATGAGSEVHYVDEAGIFPGTVAAWSIGGFVGTTSIQLLRSDGLHVRQASVGTPALVATPSQTVTVYDYEATPGTNYTYTAVTVSGVYASLASATSNSASVPTGLGFWEIDPTNYPSATNAQPVQWNIQNYEQSAAHPVVGQTTVNVVASAMQVADMSATFKIFKAAINTAFVSLLLSQKTVFISNPYGEGYYFRLAPAPGGMSGGSGNKAHDSQLQASSAAAPYKIQSVTGVGQPRPAV